MTPVIAPVKKRPNPQTGPAIPPLKNYVPISADVVMPNPWQLTLAQMATPADVDSIHFPYWLAKYGGFHFDTKLNHFVHD